MPLRILVLCLVSASSIFPKKWYHVQPSNSTVYRLVKKERGFLENFYGSWLITHASHVSTNEIARSWWWSMAKFMVLGCSESSQLMMGSKNVTGFLSVRGRGPMSGPFRPTQGVGFRCGKMDPALSAADLLSLRLGLPRTVSDWRPLWLWACGRGPAGRSLGTGGFAVLPAGGVWFIQSYEWKGMETDGKTPFPLLILYFYNPK